MNWTALGENTVPGDVQRVLGVASAFRLVGDEAGTLTTRLRALDGGTGPTIWRGPAADEFRELLGKAGPDLIKLASSYQAAQDAVQRYAAALGDAQQIAIKAGTDAEAAVADRAAADTKAKQAAGEAEAQESTVRSAGARIAESRQLAGQSVDPAQVASYQQYEQQVGAQQQAASDRAAAARGSETAARQQIDAADQRLAAARALAQQAAEMRDGAATAAATTLDAAGEAGVEHRTWIERAWHWADDKLRDITSSPTFMAWMDMLGNVGDVLGVAATILSFIPVLNVAAGPLLAAGLAFKGAAFLGTGVAALHGKASVGQVVSRGVDFLLVGKGALAVKKGKVIINRAGLLGGQVKRSLFFADARRATGFWRKIKVAPKPKSTMASRLAEARGMSPQAFYQAKTKLKAIREAHRAVRTTEHTAKDISHFGEPGPHDDYAHRRPARIAGQLVDGKNPVEVLIPTFARG